MRKILLLTLFFSVFANNIVNSADTGDTYLTAPAMDSTADPISAEGDKAAEGADILSQFFEISGPMGNFVLKAGVSETSSTGDYGAYVRVDPETKELYTVSKINPEQGVEEKRASRFQAVFLSNYEKKLFPLKPKVSDKKNLAKDPSHADYTAAAEKFRTAIENYNDMAKEELSQSETSLLVDEFDKLIKLITTGDPADSETDKKAFEVFIDFAKNSVNGLILALQEKSKDKKTAEVFVNTLKQWDFGFSTKIEGTPSNGDVVVIYSQAAKKYLSVTKETGVGGVEVLYLSATSDDPIAATQFKVQEVGGRIGLTCQSEVALNMAVQATPPAVESDIESVKVKMTRLMLSARGEKPFGQIGTEDEQFEISGSAGNFLLQSSNEGKGFLTVDDTDENYLRVYDSSKAAKTKDDSGNSQKFKFVVISKSKAFYDALSKAREEKNATKRLEIYASLVETIASVENGTILLEELKKFVLANKTNAKAWNSFNEGVTPGLQEIITAFNETFAAEIQGTPKLKAARDSLATTLTEPFVAKLEDGFYAVAWVNKAGEKKFLQLVNEERKGVNYTTQFKITATGTDQLNPKSIFKLKIDAAAKTLQMEAEYKKADVISGPNAALGEGEASHTTVKVSDKSVGTAIKYLRVSAWRQNSDKSDPPTPEDQAPFTFEFQGSTDNMNLKSKQSSGYWFIDEKGETVKEDGKEVVKVAPFSVRTLDDSDTPLAKPGNNSRFALVRISDEQMEMARTRAKSIAEQIEFYLKSAEAVDPKTPKTTREELISELEKFFKKVTSSPSDYKTAKESSDKVDQLVATISSDRVSTYKTISEKTKKIKAVWQAGFSGPVENNQWYVFSWKDAAGTNKIIKLELEKSKDKPSIYKLKTFEKSGKQDELAPLARLKALVGDDGTTTFETSIGGKTLTLSVSDDATAAEDSKKRAGLVAKEVSSPGDAEKFSAITNENGTVSFKSKKTGGFITIDTGGSVSTLSELTKQAAGLTGEDGELDPEPGAKLTKTMLTDFHTSLSEIRSISQDLPRLAKYIEKANYSNISQDQSEALAGELTAWVNKIIQDKTRYKTLSGNKAFLAQLNSAVDKVLSKLADGSDAKKSLGETKNTWSDGFIGSKHPAIPDAGKKIILQLTDGTSNFLRAAKDEDSGKILLKADAKTALESGTVFEVMLKGERVGLKSVANDGKVLMAPALPSDAAEWTPRRKKTETALHFVPADEAKFKQTQATGSQFILPEAATKESASFQAVPHEDDDPLKKIIQGFISTQGDDKAARIIDPATLQALVPETPATKEKFKIILVNSVYNQALELIKETDHEKLISGFKTMARQCKPATTDKQIFMDAFKIAFTDKKDFTLSQKAKEVIAYAKEEWGAAHSADLDGKLKATLDSMLLLGKSFSEMITTSAREIIQAPKEERVEQIKKLVDEKLSKWETALVDNWTDEKIRAELGIDEGDTSTRANSRVATERLNAIRDILKALKPLTKLDRSDASGISEVNSEIRSQAGDLSRDLKSLRRSG